MKTRIFTILSLLLVLVAMVISRVNADTVKTDLPLGTYPTISAAYTVATNDATIMLKEATFDEKLSFSVTKTILLKGGYATDFTPSAGYSVVRGTLMVSGGTVHVKQIVIRDAGTVPGTPAGVSATAGNTPNTVIVSIGATDDGGSPITSYNVTGHAYPDYTATGITATGSTPPITVTCPSTCTGLAFTVFATNAIGSGAQSARTDVITSYDVVETFLEPQTAPRNSIFIGSFNFNSTTSTVSNLQGVLSESMSGDPVAIPTYDYGMAWVPLTNQLSSHPVTLGGVSGLLVTTFRNSNTNTFWVFPPNAISGWAPADGVAVGGVYYGFPKPVNNPGNAYAMIFVNTTDPTVPLAQAQIDKLAYADCAPGGMMAASCMTGTTVAGYGAIGTMSGYPVSQVITRQ